MGADVDVVSDGYTGFTTVLTLCRAGYQVTLVDSRRISWDASGRNGG
ncbi:MAG: FAD-dependent oxidoreductase [Arenicellales bacterium]